MFGSQPKRGRIYDQGHMLKNWQTSRAWTYLLPGVAMAAMLTPLVGPLTPQQGRYYFCGKKKSTLLRSSQ